MIETLALYLRLDFGRFHARNPQIIALADRIARTPSAVALKLTNLAALDESLPQKGMAHVSAADRAVWAEFLAVPDKVLAAFAAQTTAAATPVGDGFDERQAAFAARQTESRSAVVTPRIGQSFFREVILTSYRGRCALTGNDDLRLLTASHIVGWAEDTALRVNPANGICLNALHDRAFDRHLITFDEDYRLKIAADVPPDARRALANVESGRLEMPARFLPDQGFLDRHRRRFYARQRGLISRRRGCARWSGRAGCLRPPRRQTARPASAP